MEGLVGQDWNDDVLSKSIADTLETWEDKFKGFSDCYSLVKLRFIIKAGL